MASPYTLPPDEDVLTGACAFGGGVCAWAGAAAYRWRPEGEWTALSDAPAPIDSGFEVQSGVLAGAGTHIGFLPADGTDWAGWVNLSTFSDAHPMYGDLLLCIDAGTETYTLFAVSERGLDPLSTFDADELADPVAGWSAPATPERVLLLGEGGLWSLNPPYTAADHQHLVSFDDIDLPAFEDIPGPFQPGPATVVIPRRTRTGLRLDLSDGSGRPTGLAHLPGGTPLWTAYLQDDTEMATRLLAALARLPAPTDETLRLHDVWTDDGTIRVVATSAGLHVPSDEARRGETRPADLRGAPLDASALATWGLWLGEDEALEAGCRQLCADPDYALVESLRVFGGKEAVHVLFDLLRSEDPPVGPEAMSSLAPAVVRALVAPFGDDVAEVVAAALGAASIPARAAACMAAGAVRADRDPDATPSEEEPVPALWSGDRPLPTDELIDNAGHDHPAVQTAARSTCARLSIGDVPSP